MKIIGIHDGHNASACLLVDGKLEFAIQEERLTRIKNHSTFPQKAIQFMLESYDLTAGDIDYIVLSSFHMPRNLNREQLMLEYKESSSLKINAKRKVKNSLSNTPVYRLYRNQRKAERIKKVGELGFDNKKIIFKEHHLSHAASAYYSCPWWKDEEVLILTNDAGGDDLSATVSIGKNGTIKRICDIPVADSLGYIYSMITYLMGMVPEEHEYKLMGMAPYSSRDKYEKLLARFKNLLRFIDSEKGMKWVRSNGCPHTQFSYSYFRRFIELERFDNICGALQDFTENMLTTWVTNCIKGTRIGKVALSGGVFMNVKVNKKIMELEDVDSMYVFPSCGDETNCIGAAYLTYIQKCNDNKKLTDIQPVKDLYLGPEYTDEEIESVITGHGFGYHRSDDIESEIAELMQNGKIVARFKGRMEFGARALGNRTILADPSRTDVVKTINEMIKNRDFWMPFAPSIMEDCAQEYLVNPKNIDSPYMIMSYESTDKIDQIRAGSHPYDNTIRPQIVYKSWNADIYKLIKKYKELTGRGAVLNTSFNLHGYPIVCSPRDAMQVFEESGLEYLAMGNYLVEKLL